MKILSVRRLLSKIWLVFILLATSVSATSGAASSSPQPPSQPAPGAAQAPLILHGQVKNQAGQPVQAAISATNRQWTSVANLLTAPDGTYTVTVAVQEDLAVTAAPQGLPENLIHMPDGYQTSRYFEITKGIQPVTGSLEVNFTLLPAAALRLDAYDPTGSRMNFNQLYTAINPPAYYFDGVYGVFPMSRMDLPVPAEPSVGILRWAWPPDNNVSLWEPCFGVPVGEPVFIMMLWEVPGIGTFPLRADNQGLGYTFSNGEARSINLVYDFAETEHRRALELKASLEAQGHTFSAGLLDMLEQSNTALDQASSQSDEAARATLSYEVLRLSIKAKEQLTMEAAEADIPNRKDNLKIVVQDAAGNPVPDAALTYHQKNLDFVLTFAQGVPVESNPDPGFHAGLDMGFQSLYDVIYWSKVSPQDGVFDYSYFDAGFNHKKGMGFEITAALAWLGGDNVPTWAQNLDFPDFQQKLAEFVRKTVEHYNGVVKYMIVAPEINLQTIAGSRYVSVAYPSNYLTGMQPADLIELIRTAFQAARDAHSSCLLGYYGITDYIYGALNPLPFGAWPQSYTFLKSVLDSGVHPDFVGIEPYPGTADVPLDLSTLAAMLKAYHDLSGLPVLVAETLAYSSRMEDYGEPGPNPHVYWHAGKTQATQAEWETSFYKIAMSQPYVLGIQMLHSLPDYPTWAQGDLADIFIGNGVLTRDYVPKQDYYDMHDLIASWKANGSLVTNSAGAASFYGLGGDYSMAVTTPNGLSQSFERQFSTATQVVTLTLAAPQAILDLQQSIVKAQKAVDWSAQLGRLLDYNQLRARLASARSAMAAGDYVGARSYTDQVLDATAIQIDGEAQDWQGIPPIKTAPPGGVQVNAPGIDLKALYGMLDDQNVYLMLEVYDPPITLQPGEDSAGTRYPFFDFTLGLDTNNEFGFGTYLPYRAQIDLARSLPAYQFIGTYYSAAYHNVLEIKIPLALIGNPSQVCSWGFVMALENGQGKVAKAVEGCSRLPHPVPALYLPVVVK